MIHLLISREISLWIKYYSLFDIILDYNKFLIVID
jgi:hypothetical protein